jgi:uncharacterized protein with FMN-binding domain
MKKYFKISVVLVIFGILVLLRQLKGDNQQVVVLQKNNQPTPTQSFNSSSNSMMQAPRQMMGLYKNGVYTGSVEDAFYGIVQVQVTVANGKISDVSFLQYPNDNKTSQFVSSQAMPLLRQEAIQAQNAQVDIVSGASATSQAFQASLVNALAKAK